MVLPILPEGTFIPTFATGPGRRAAPPWINPIGGWTNPETVSAFGDCVKKLAAALQGHVRIWNTFNEPDTYACCAFVLGEFPPQQRWRVGAFRRVIHNMAKAHAQVCTVIRETGSAFGPVEVGFSKNWTFFLAHRKWFAWDAAFARFAHSQFNQFVLEAFQQGAGGQAATFLGVNYYGRIRQSISQD